MGPHKPHESQVLGPAPWSGQVQSIQAGELIGREQLCGEVLGNGGGYKNEHEPAIGLHRSESKLYPILHQKKHGQQIKGSDCSTLI